MVAKQLLTLPQLKDKGFITLELLAAMGIIALAASLTYLPSKTYLEQYRRLQVRTAAHRLVADLRNMQQKALFGLANNDSFHVLDTNEGYYITKASESITTNFSDINCDGVYFSQDLGKPLHYTNIGAPTVTGSYILKHLQANNITCIITIQPSSGRVDLNESN